MNTRATVIASILIVLIIPAMNAKPVIIRFEEKIDQNLIKEHGIANYTQYNITNAISADIPESVSEK